MIAAALGIRRYETTESLEIWSELKTLTFGVRIDQPGELTRDWQTAHTFDGKVAFTSTRFYLTDAVFLAGLEGDEALLIKIDNALKTPIFPLFLGRRSCPPELPVSLGIKIGLPLEKTLSEEPWQAKQWYRKKMSELVALEIVRDATLDEDSGDFLRDIPLTFNQEYRQYTFRSVMRNRHGVEIKNEASRFSPDNLAAYEIPTAHDPFNEVEVEDVSIPS
jgi:CRISPR system Cascade subunit CasD